MGAGGRSLAAATVLAALLGAGVATPAQAQFFPWGGGWNNSPPWEQQRRPQRRAAPRFAEPQDDGPVVSTLPKPEGPLLVVISIGKQTVTVYDGVKKIATSPISSGMPGHETPTGVFSLLEKNRYHYSNLYGGAPMPFMQRVTNSGVAMHAGVVPGYPASHGCIRLPYNFARNLFGITDVGARVIINQDDLTPTEFHDPHLIAPLAPDNQAQNDNNDGSEMLTATPVKADFSAKPRTRAMAAAARAAAKVQLAAAITAAEAAKTAAIDRAKAASTAASNAKDDVRKARNERERLADAARKAAKDADRAAERFTDLTAKMAKVDVDKLVPAELEKQSAEELAEEAKVLDMAKAATAAKELLAPQVEVVAKAVADAEAAEKARRAALDDVKKAEQPIVDAKAALASAEAIEARKDQPVAIFISSKTGRLFAKLGFEQVIDVPVTIADPGKPLGTHILTATAFTSGEKDLRWTAVTVTPGAGGPPRRSYRRKHRHEDESYVPPAGEDADAASALARIEIPEDTREQLAELMKPGSSYIISDYPLSRETSKRTEFIVEPWRSRGADSEKTVDYY